MYTGLTKAGEIYLANRLANKLPVNFLKVKIGNGTVPHGADASETTELYSFKKEIQILDITQTDNVARIRVLIDNSDVEQGFFMKELGVYVDDDGKEKLYWYVYEDNGQYVHSKTERAIQFDLELVMEVTSSNSTILDWNKDKVWISKTYFDEKVRTYEIPTIADLQSRKNLKVGDIVEVLGYYSAGDGAGHKRIIKAEDDGSGVQLRSGKWANIVHNGEVNVSWFGVKETGNYDDILEKVINKYRNVIIDKSFSTYRTINIIKEGVIIKGLGDSRYDVKITATHKNVMFKFNPTVQDNNNDQPKCPEFYWITAYCSEFYEVYDRNGVIQDGDGLPYFLRPKVQKCFLIFNGDTETQRDCKALIFSKAFDFSVRENNFRGFPNGVLFKGCDISEFSLNRIEGFKREAITVERSGTFGSDLIINHCDLMISDCFLDEANTRYVIKNLGYGTKIINNYMEYTGNVKNSRKAFILTSSPVEILDNRLEGSTTLEGLIRIENSIIINKAIFNIKIDGLYNSRSDIGKILFLNAPLSAGFNRVRNIDIKNVEGSHYNFFKNFNKLIIDYSNVSYFSNDGDNGNTLLIGDDNSILGKDGINLHIDLKKLHNFFKSSGLFKIKVIYSSKNQKFVRVDKSIYNGELLTSFNLPSNDVPNLFEKEIEINDGYPYIIFMTDSNFKIYSIEITKENIIPKEVVQMQKLNTLHMGEKMKQEGVYNDYISYMDEKTAYDKQQRRLEQDRQLSYEEALKENPELTYEEFMSVQPMTLNLVEEPQPSQALKKFMEKYL